MSDLRDGAPPKSGISIDEPVLTSDKAPPVGHALSSNAAFLAAPLTGPNRPLSPDTLSQLSINEYEQLHPSVSIDPAILAPHKGGWRANFQASWVRNKGLFLMLVAQMFGTLMNVATRLLETGEEEGHRLNPFHILFVRMGLTCILASAWMNWQKTPDFPFGHKSVRPLLGLRGFGGFFGVFGMYYSLQYLPLSEATVITFLAPSLTCWACSVLIKEPFTRAEQLGTLVSFVGVILIAQPSTFFTLFMASDSQSESMESMSMTDPTTAITRPRLSVRNFQPTPQQRLSAVAMALLGVLGSATAFTTMRWIGKRAHPLLSVNYFSTMCTLASLVAMLTVPGIGFRLPSNAKEWGLLLALGVFGFIMQFLLAAALAYEKSSRATNVTYTQMLFALGFDKVIFGHTPGIWSIIGSSLILGSAIVVAMQNSTRTKVGTEPESRDVSASDPESQRGLLQDQELIEVPVADDEPLQNIQLRALR